MSKKVMTLEEKNEILSDAIKILESGSKPKIDAFKAGINILLKAARSRKKTSEQEYEKIRLKLERLAEDARRGLS